MNPFIRFIVLYITAVLASALIPWLSAISELAFINNEYGNKLFWKVMRQIPIWEFCISITIASFLIPYAMLWSEQLREDSLGRLFIGKLEKRQFEQLIFLCVMSTSFVVLPISFVFFIDHPDSLRISGMYVAFAIWILHGAINGLHLYQLSRKLVLHSE